MSSRLGSIEIECDVPHDCIVRACERLEYRSPFDVRWCRISNLLEAQPQPAAGFHPLRWLFGGSPLREFVCTCGQPLPPMQHYTFAFPSQKKLDYLLGQCCLCRTMFWEEVAVRRPEETELDSSRI
jgi:hypothetical protein